MKKVDRPIFANNFGGIYIGYLTDLGNHQALQRIPKVEESGTYVAGTNTTFFIKRLKPGTKPVDSDGYEYVNKFFETEKNLLLPDMVTRPYTYFGVFPFVLLHSNIKKLTEEHRGRVIYDAVSLYAVDRGDKIEIDFLNNHIITNTITINL